MTEKLLISKAKSGNKAAVEEIVETYYTEVYRFLARRHGDSFIAEDITQDTFLKFTQNLSTYKDKGKLKSYIFSIAVNCSNDYFRKIKQQSELPLDNTEETVIKTTPETDFELSDKAMRIKTAVLSLDDGFRDVTILRYYHDMKLSEIALALGIPTSTVKTRLHRAKKILGESLKGEQYD